jgi:hypothetical protein
MPIPNKNKTGGPRSAGGGLRIAGNAVKTGAYSLQVVLPGEDAGQFEELKRQLVEDFDPVGLAEAAMVHDLAVLSWKKLRIDRVENAVMAQMILLPLPEDRIQKSFGADFLPAAMPWLVPHKPVTEQEFDSVTKLLEQVQSLLNTPPANRDHSKLRKKWQHLYEVIDECAADYGLVLNAQNTPQECAENDAILNKLLAAVSETYRPICWLWENRERVDAALRRAQDSKLL